jgi:hypothetical protein
MSTTLFTNDSLTKALRQAAYWIDHHPDEHIDSFLCESNPNGSWSVQIRHTEIINGVAK